MTHVVNLLPWRDLRRRQRLRYVLLLTIGIVLLGGMGLLVSRTARLQRDFLATLHTTADAQLLASLKQREQAMQVQLVAQNVALVAFLVLIVAGNLAGFFGGRRGDD